MDLVVSLRKAHDAFPTAICWPDPKTYSSHCKHRTISDNRVHRYPSVGDGIVARDDHSPRRAGDRDHRRPEVGGDSVGLGDGFETLPTMIGSRRGLREAKGSDTSRRTGAGSRGNRGKERKSSSDGPNRHTAHAETLLEPAPSAPPRRAAEEPPPSPRSRASPARGKWFPC